MSELDDVKTTVAVIDGLRFRIAELEAHSEWIAKKFLTTVTELKAALAERDEAMTIAYRLWLQGYHEEVGDYLLPFSADLRARAEEGSGDE